MLIKKKSENLLLTCFLIIISAGFISAQGKKNSRPSDGVKKPKKIEKQTDKNITEPVYFYEFTQPKFSISKIIIEHDDKGSGKITFHKKGFDESITESLKLSVNTLEKLNTLWTELNFLDSDETYQSEKRDYGHLGEIKIKMKKDEKERTTEFNWTENLNAKELANEYRKISNQYVWMFDMNVAGENQPLESPKIMKRFDSFLKRNEISDPKNVLPYLKEISEDERFPLITRNHAARLLTKIEKIKEKEQ